MTHDDTERKYNKARRDLQHALTRQMRRRNSVLRAFRKLRDREHALRVDVAGKQARIEYLEGGLRQMRDNLTGASK